MDHPTDRIAHTMAFVTPVMEHWLEREIAQWVHSMKDRSDDPSHHERTLSTSELRPAPIHPEKTGPNYQYMYECQFILSLNTEHIFQGRKEM